MSKEIQDHIEGHDGELHMESLGRQERTVRQIAVDGPQDADVELKVRTEGAIIRDLRVDGTQILASSDTSVHLSEVKTRKEFAFEDNPQPLKIDGTITTLPYGPTDGGPQHGLSRILTYESIPRSSANSLNLMARDPVMDLNHFKEFVVEPDGLSVVDEVVNTSDHETNLSIGEHYYFAVDKEKLADVKFLDETGAEQSIRVRKELGEDDDHEAIYGEEETGTLSSFLDDLKDGKTLYLEGFTGTQVISIPGIGEITLTAEAVTNLSAGNMADDANGQTQSVALLIWHRPGTDTICFEPVAGVTINSEGREVTDGLTIPAGKLASFTSRVKLNRVDPNH